MLILVFGHAEAWRCPNPRLGLGGGQLRWVVAGGVVAGVVGPTAPHDPDPAGAESSQRPVLALTAGPAGVVDGLGPGVIAGGDEHPPVVDVSHPPARDVAEPDLPGPPRRFGDRRHTFDAFVLADTVRHEHRRWRPLSVPSALTAELQAVSRDRQRVQHAKVACESRLRAVLDTYHPAPLHLFSELDRNIALEFIRSYPTPDQARRVGTTRMERFCYRQGYSGRTDPQVLVDRLRPHMLGASEGTTAGKSFAADLFAEELRLHTDHLRAFDHKITQLLDQHPDAPIFLSFTGIGTVVAAALIAEMGDDRSRFPTVEVLLAKTGLCPTSTPTYGTVPGPERRSSATHRTAAPAEGSAGNPPTGLLLVRSPLTPACRTDRAARPAPSARRHHG